MHWCVGHASCTYEYAKTDGCYLKPSRCLLSLQIFIREKKVKVKRMTSLLREKIQETYRPQHSPDCKCDIEMGFNTENENLYGMMLYHRNRLIRPYHRSVLCPFACLRQHAECACCKNCVK